MDIMSPTFISDLASNSSEFYYYNNEYQIFFMRKIILLTEDINFKEFIIRENLSNALSLIWSAVKHYDFGFDSTNTIDEVYTKLRNLLNV